MSELTHTPGPWKLGINGPMDIECPNGDLVATVWLSDVELDAAKANLALILAAPELLKALESLYRLTDWLPDQIVELNHNKEAIEAAKLAIEKATQKPDAP